MEDSNPLINSSEIEDDYSQRSFRLNKQEINNPQLVITDFWERYSLQSFRKHLWNRFIKNLLMGNIDPLGTAELYIDMERMIEVTFLLRNQVTNNTPENK